MGINVKLQVFEGPLDLLLHLIDKNKVNIYDIPIVMITEQYMEYVNSMDKEDLDVVSEFLVMAATLLDIKSRMLLPQEVNEEGELEDPRAELVEKLLEYKLFKYMSYELKDKQVDAEKSFYKEATVPPEVEAYKPPMDMDELVGDTTLAMLNSIFQDVMKRQEEKIDPIRSKFGKIEKEKVSMADKALEVKEFISNIQEKALGQEVLKSLKPGEQVVKIVKDEMVELLGGTESKINLSPNPPTIIMLVGLQGSGKTTTAGKLANLLRKQGKKPLLVACDVYRPAAIKQLQVVGGQLNIPVYAEENSKDVVGIAKRAMNTAISKLNDVIILDTAGRLHIDNELMEELQNVKKSVKPHEILLVVDSMTGQDAVNVAETFNTQVGIDGVILTKLDEIGRASCRERV